MLLGEDVRNFIQSNLNIRSTLFWLHQKRELKQYKSYFDTVESKPLTELQRRAVILDERRNLVVAGAGTGKTSVIVAKAGYLIESGKCRPEDILLLAFNTDAAKELAERCESRLGVKILASTFHALGNQIVGAVEPEVMDHKGLRGFTRRIRNAWVGGSNPSTGTNSQNQTLSFSSVARRIRDDCGRLCKRNVERPANRR